MSDRLDECLEIVDRALQQVRDLSFDLRPSLLDDLGLIAALRWYLDRLSRRAGFTAHFTADSVEARLPPRHFVPQVQSIAAVDETGALAQRRVEHRVPVLVVDRIEVPERLGLRGAA